ncbi:hypothetical protein ASPZODRAFT_150833 [Penicilliopsis zonata CBS 506.65]|uniref:tripeptidyl-peptidase II n=1 Tax=Penicilliopsis zonata CBS 506.65 TaxID=1073090 RepID=A0A1L9SNF5_9EURO|nr:hypothetical protein ASPZODRAFT_150833 [Penicilliopsis zonata CBS 506.65]OJJ48643.1 hypothetical protein ASPZODRAFT_150833 [Penicilliopsis zonata CBS 506.65]
MRSIPSLLGTLSLFVSSLQVGYAAEQPHRHYQVVERLDSAPYGWTRGGKPPPNQEIRFRLAAQHGRAAEFEQKVTDLSSPGHESYGHHMKRDDVRDFLQPATETLENILGWLDTEHVPENSIQTDGYWITFSVPVSQAEQIFNTQFYYFHNMDSDATLVRTLQYSVPDNVYVDVQMIQPTTRFGNFGAQRTLPAIKAVAATFQDLTANCSSAITPDCLRQLYGLYDAKGKPDPQNRLGISGFLEQYARFGDFEQFLAKYSPNITDANFTVVSINGGLNEQKSGLESTEASLDVQYAISLAYDTLSTFYTTAGRGPLVPEVDQPNANESTNEPYLDQLHYLLNLTDDELPAVLSTSYGEDEQSVPESYSNITCNMFAQLGARGVSIIFSSGDSGVGDSCLMNDGSNRTRFLPTFPASCPFVTSVGGTYGINPEKAISFSGGGFSERFPRPEWQNKAVESYLTQLGNQWDGLYNRQGRGFPDVAAQADNYLIIDHGATRKIGGTSAAAPVFAAVISQLNSARLTRGKPRLGFLNPWLYSLNQTGFTDIRQQFDATNSLLSRAKRFLLLQNALIPTPQTPPQLVAVAREVLELGALASIRQTDAPSFTRYYQQLQPFYDIERHVEATGEGVNVDFSTSQRSKITGLYLLLLLSMGNSTGFHTVLEGLVEEASLKGKSVEDDPYIKYPVDLERSLMEGSYDKVWRETKSERVPSEDFGLFSNVLVGTIRSEIADCSEKAYPSLPISNAKNLLFLESEGAVIEFAQQRGWILRDGRIYFPVEPEAAARSEKDILAASGTIIENTIGYARELETIV